MEQKNSLQFFFLSLIVGTILLVGTFSFTSLTKAVLNPDVFSHFKKNTYIGPLDVSGLDREQTVQLIETKVAAWEQENQLSSQFLFDSALLEKNATVFDIQGSVKTAVNGQENKLLVFLDEELWNQHISDLGFTGSEELVDWATYKKDLLSIAQELKPFNQPSNLTTYINSQQTGISELAQGSMTFPFSSDGSGSSWLRKHSKIIVEPNQTLSLNEIFETEPDGLYTEKFKTILASTIYKTALESPFQISQRQISQTNAYSIQSGYEAFVNETQDFVIENVYGYPLTIQTTVDGNQLIISVLGPDLGVEVDLEPLQRKVLPYRVQIQTIEKSMPQKTDKGIEGVEVDVTRTVFLNREKKATYVVAKDLYFPVHEIQYRHEVDLLSSTASETNTSPTATSGNSNSAEGNDYSIDLSEGTGTSRHETIIPPGGTSTDSDPDEILKDDQTKATK